MIEKHQRKILKGECTVNNIDFTNIDYLTCTIVIIFSITVIYIGMIIFTTISINNRLRSIRNELTSANKELTTLREKIKSLRH